MEYPSLWYLAQKLQTKGQRELVCVDLPLPLGFTSTLAEDALSVLCIGFSVHF